MSNSAHCPLVVDITLQAEGWPEEELLSKRIESCLVAAFQSVKLEVIPDTEVSLVFSDDAQVQELNRMWRNKDKPTNVLSFPGDDKEEPPYGPLLGDIILARETVERESGDLGIPFDHHLAHLIVHGTLHLFGYDHQDDEEAEEMEGEERKILALLGIPDPYQDAPLSADE
ncbi:rRNA maturation RNase YbeY [Flexibacterium corallicola]|uniref:rRNA maturation RNase YbeY n=1 Tax=Flexibacterium corallicola TaxID=3037259 RepID=UPI00286F7C73|nr:rRNA maturation RNase YbeY [Pseudovibrio sp. M1P-2-3]